MLAILYNIIVTPLVYLIELVFAVLNRFFVNPGLSIIGVSLAVNFLALPLYRRADLIQEEERDKQASMAKWVDHIKATFKGDEQYMMLTAYYRLQDYKPAQALRSSLSLLLQIPFFMAAYNYLSHLGELQGAQFLFINDLSRPDQLLTIGGIAINVLPIVMTLINCFSTSVYTKDLPLRDKIQAYGLAAVFLVLLYQSPAGLVFYWTCNQVFSLVKNIFFKLLKNPRRVFAILVQVVFVVVGAFLIHGGRLSSPRRIVGAIAFILIVEAALFLLPRLKAKRGGASEGNVEDASPTRSFLLAALLITAILGVLIPSAVIGASPKEFINVYAIQDPLRHIVTTTSILGGLVVLWGGVYYYLGDSKTRKAMALIYWILAGVCLIDFLFFGRNLGTITKNLVFEAYPTYPLGEKLLNLAAIAILAAAMLFAWRTKRNLVNPVLGMLIIAVLGVSVPNIVGIRSATAEMQAMVSQSTVAADQDDYAGATYFNADGSVRPLINLSSNGRNVIVLFMDRCMGTYLPYILNEKPELKELFDGFTYYPNTLSYGSCTVYGGPPLYGGYEYVPTEMNKRDTELLSDKHDEAISVMPTLFTQAGFTAVQFDPPMVHYSYTEQDYSCFDAIDGFSTYWVGGVYTDYYENRESDRFGGENDRSEENLTRSFVFYSLFKAAPVALQTTVYDQGKYYSTLASYAVNSDFIDNYSVLALLDELTSVSADGSDNFVILHNDTSHSPQILQLPDYTPSDHVDNEGLEDLSRFTVDGRTMDVSRPNYLASYHANMAALLTLADWCDYLRATGAYDNTRIIIVSDHGYPFEQFEDLVLDRDQEIWQFIRLNVNSFNPLLMVKDFDAHGFTVSDEFMTNADTPTIALEGIVENPVNPYTGNPITNEDKYTQDQLVTTSWHHNVESNHRGTVFETGDGYWYSVHDNIFEPENWTLVQGPTE
ncbi:MAG: membrane protein insertase YidC [Atopobiaceae bacterium]|nr:membrane protein insertase YidC [Atopobiaceae bacterium]